jgi:phosphopantetheinyl transferase
VFSAGWRKQAEQGAPAASAQNTIEIWIASTDGIFRAKSCLQLLTAGDQASLLRIQDPANRHSALAARILLRLGLSRATAHRIAPARWQFVERGQQRPTISPDLPQLHYSVSHADEVVAVAISRTVEVGIDIESVDHAISDAMLAEFCHAEERRSASRLPNPQKSREFTRMWTLKEAYTKMRGVGHALDFKRLNFSPDRINCAPKGADDDATVCFENFYVSVGHGLFHASLAYAAPKALSRNTEVGLITLVDPAGRFVNVTPSPI